MFFAEQPLSTHGNVGARGRLARVARDSKSLPQLLDAKARQLHPASAPHGRLLLVQERNQGRREEEESRYLPAVQNSVLPTARAATAGRLADRQRDPETEPGTRRLSGRSQRTGLLTIATVSVWWLADR